MQIVFEVETAHGKFCDALYFEDDAVPDEATIEAMKQERVDNWIAIVTAPSQFVSKYQRDENGNLILDANGDPIFKKDENLIPNENGNLILDENGNPTFDENGNLVFDTSGNPIPTGV